MLRILLIYVYKYPNNLLYTVGYESSDVNRNYTVGYDVECRTFKSDIRIVGVNSGFIICTGKTFIISDNIKKSIES